MNIGTQDDSNIEISEKEIIDFILKTFSEVVNIDEKEIIENNFTLSQIIHKSDKLYNSVDLMEAFAKVASRIKKAYNVKIKLPNFPLDTHSSILFQALGDEYKKVKLAKNTAGDKV